MDSVKLYHIELVRDRDIEYKSIKLAEQAAEVFHELLDRSPVEQLAVIHLEAGGRMVGVEKVGLGTLTSVSVTMGEIFRGALIAAVPTIILGHNHPTNDLKPSQHDWDLTDKARDLGAQLGVNVGDHIIVTPDGKHTSMRTMDSDPAMNDAYMREIASLMKTLPPREQEFLIKRAASYGMDLTAYLTPETTFSGDGDADFPFTSGPLASDYQEGEIFPKSLIGTNMGDLLRKSLNKKN
jgi:DNA repair protein RadC